MVNRYRFPAAKHQARINWESGELNSYKGMRVAAVLPEIKRKTTF